MIVKRFIVAVAISGPTWDDCSPYARAFVVEAENVELVRSFAWSKAKDLYCTGLLQGSRVDEVRIYPEEEWTFIRKCHPPAQGWQGHYDNVVTLDGAGISPET